MQTLKLYLDTSFPYCISYIPQIVAEQLQLKFIRHPQSVLTYVKWNM